MTAQPGGYLERPAPSGLADVVEVVLDKGLVIDAYVRVSLLGIELLTVDARIVVASIDTYLRFAEATNRLDLHEHGGKDLTELVEDSVGTVVENLAENVVEDKVSGVVETVTDTAAAAADKVGDVAENLADSVEDLFAPEAEEPGGDAPSTDRR